MRPFAELDDWVWDDPRANVWIGTSVETQKWADVRIPTLLETPAAVRFLSVEPLLGPVDLSSYLHPPRAHETERPTVMHVHLSIRRGHLVGATGRPDSAWVTQQARNLAIEERLTGIWFLLHDRDTKFSGP